MWKSLEFIFNPVFLIAYQHLISNETNTAKKRKKVKNTFQMKANVISNRKKSEKLFIKTEFISVGCLTRRIKTLMY